MGERIYDYSVLNSSGIFARLWRCAGGVPLPPRVRGPRPGARPWEQAARDGRARWHEGRGSGRTASDPPRGAPPPAPRPITGGAAESGSGWAPASAAPVRARATGEWAPDPAEWGSDWGPDPGPVGVRDPVSDQDPAVGRPGAVVSDWGTARSSGPPGRQGAGLSDVPAAGRTLAYPVGAYPYVRPRIRLVRGPRCTYAACLYALRLVRPPSRTPRARRAPPHAPARAP